MNNLSSFELTDFNVSGHIDLNEKCGMIKIARAEDGVLTLVTDADYVLMHQDKPSPARILNIDSALAFVLDIGIRREKELTIGGGHYFGFKLIPSPQSARKITQTDFDSDLLGKIDSVVNGLYQSGDSKKESSAIQMNHLLNAYNKARLLYPNFYNESYLSLMRILDALSGARGAPDFAVSIAQVSSSLNCEIYDKIAKIGGLKPRLKIAEDLFSDLISNKALCRCVPLMKTFDQYERVMFSIFYSAYQYRSKFVHQGLPFPDAVRRTFCELKDGTAYLSPVSGSAFIKIFRPTGRQDGDDIDIHDVIIPDKNQDEIKRFKEIYFLLIPTWHFLKRMTREALITKLNKL